MTLQINVERKSIWNFLKNPAVYRLSQKLLAPGGEESVLAEMRKFCNPSMLSQPSLEIGSGPKSLLWNLPLRPLGLDAIHAYNVQFSGQGGKAVTGSATSLPFLGNSFDNIWSIGLLHHLSDQMADQTVHEMLRVVRPGGWIILFDGVMPVSAQSNPLIWVLRKLDRGQNMRKQERLEFLLPDRPRWKVKRFQYCFWGHEGVLCSYQKPSQ